MKFIHHSVASICSFVADNNLTITRVHADGQNTGEISSTPDLLEMLEKSNKLWGTILDYFFIVTDYKFEYKIDLTNAVISVESGAINGFVLVAYQDGGVISVSGKAYPFQKDAESASWWRV